VPSPVVATHPPSGEAQARRRFREHSVVTLRRPVAADGRSLPAGTRATVVAAYADGVGYEIDVFAPFPAVVTVEADDLAG
jgi:hypothetical protein